MSLKSLRETEVRNPCFSSPHETLRAYSQVNCWPAAVLVVYCLCVFHTLWFAFAWRVQPVLSFPPLPSPPSEDYLWWGCFVFVTEVEVDPLLNCHGYLSAFHICSWKVLIMKVMLFKSTPQILQRINVNVNINININRFSWTDVKFCIRLVGEGQIIVLNPSPSDSLLRSLLLGHHATPRDSSAWQSKRRYLDRENHRHQPSSFQPLLQDEP